MPTVYIDYSCFRDVEIDLDPEGLLVSARLDEFELNLTDTQRAKLQKLARNAALELIEEAQTEAAILSYEYRRAVP